MFMDAAKDGCISMIILVEEYNDFRHKTGCLTGQAPNQIARSATDKEANLHMGEHLVK